MNNATAYTTTATTDTVSNGATTALSPTPVPAAQKEKTFTQAELDKIVQERLQRDRKDRADYEELKEKAAKLDKIEEAAKSDLQKATDRAEALQKELDQMKASAKVREIRDAVAAEAGIPGNLLTGDTEEACRQQADAIKAFAKQNNYPAVKDGGEVHNAPTGTSTREQFANWMRQMGN